MSLDKSKQIIKHGQNKGRLRCRYSGHANNQLKDAVVEGELQHHMESKETMETRYVNRVYQ